MKATIFCATILTLAASGAAMAQTPAAQTPAAKGAAALPKTSSAPAPTTAPAAPTTPAPAAPTATAPTPPATDASATSGFRAGLPVKDAQGQAIGTIARVIKTPDGATTYSVSIDGRNVNLPSSALTLSPTGADAISSMSKAQITASTAPPT